MTMESGNTEKDCIDILVVEDNLVNQKIISAMLSKLGYRIHLVQNGEQAVESMKTGCFGLVLMDCQMPVMDGYQATERIRALEKPGKRVPIVALSANTIHDHQHRCESAGMDDFVPKPINLKLLRDKVQHWLRGSRDVTPSDPP